MLGSRDFPKLILDKLIQIYCAGAKHNQLDADTIDVAEAIQCNRLSYYERTEPENDALPQIIQRILKLGFRDALGSIAAEYKVENLTLTVTPDLVFEKDFVVNFYPVSTLPDSLLPEDMLYTNACLFALEREVGLVVYVTQDGQQTQFFVGKSNRMFEQVVRRARILSILLGERKTPVIEPSKYCLTCKYNDRCFPQQKDTGPQLLEGLFSLGKK
jgi:CRISPR-associated exonuclease Cas4